jgi:hypothetical protein
MLWGGGAITIAVNKIAARSNNTGLYPGLLAHMLEVGFSPVLGLITILIILLESLIRL